MSGAVAQEVPPPRSDAPRSSAGRRRRRHPLARLVGTRVVAGLFVMLVVSFAMFSFIHLSPGGPEQALAGQFASERQRELIRVQYHLDDPFLTQYGNYLQSLVQLDLGRSFTTREATTVSLARAATVSVPLMVVSWSIAMVVGIALGTLIAIRRNSVLDRVIGSLTVVGASSPMFATAVLLTWLLGVKTGWLPTVGGGDGGMDSVRHLVLPVTTIVVVLLASTTKVSRAAVIDVLGDDHLAFARARGLSRSMVLRSEIMRNVATTLVTHAGTLLIALAGGQVVVESVFGLRGVGTLLTDAISTRDVPLIQAVTLVLAGFIVVVNLVTDLIVLALDPRLRKGLTP